MSARAQGRRKRPPPRRLPRPTTRRIRSPTPRRRPPRNAPRRSRTRREQRSRPNAPARRARQGRPGGGGGQTRAAGRGGQGRARKGGGERAAHRRRSGGGETAPAERDAAKRRDRAGRGRARGPARTEAREQARAGGKEDFAPLPGGGNARRPEARARDAEEAPRRATPAAALQPSAPMTPPQRRGHAGRSARQRPAETCAPKRLPGPRNAPRRVANALPRCPPSVGSVPALPAAVTGPARAAPRPSRAAIAHGSSGGARRAAKAGKRPAGQRAAAALADSAESSRRPESAAPVEDRETAYAPRATSQNARRRAPPLRTRAIQPATASALRRPAAHPARIQPQRRSPRRAGRARERPARGLSAPL